MSAPGRESRYQSPEEPQKTCPHNPVIPASLVDAAASSRILRHRRYRKKETGGRHARRCRGGMPHACVGMFSTCPTNRIPRAYWSERPLECGWHRLSHCCCWRRNRRELLARRPSQALTCPSRFSLVTRFLPFLTRSTAPRTRARSRPRCILDVSVDRGGTWRLYSKVSPTQRQFLFLRLRRWGLLVPGPHARSFGARPATLVEHAGTACRGGHHAAGPAVDGPPRPGRPDHRALGDQRDPPASGKPFNPILQRLHPAMAADCPGPSDLADFRLELPRRSHLVAQHAGWRKCRFGRR